MTGSIRVLSHGPQAEARAKTLRQSKSHAKTSETLVLSNYGGHLHITRSEPLNYIQLIDQSIII